jgi:hypothetical protein
MQKSSPQLADLLHRLANFLSWTLIFAIAYAQSPLYTSNQNQYFLHGLAWAGFGSLEQDWLANTLDPTPVFSLLVGLTYRFLHLEALFYIYYALLMGIYLFSLLGIVSLLFEIRDSRTKMLLFLALIIAVHSAALRFALSRVIGINWTYILEDGVADQRMLGPVLQPSAFGVLLLLSIYLFLLRKPLLAALSTTLAASIHPTYLLSAAALTAAFMLVTWIEERSLKKPLILGMVALLSISPILIYVYRSFGSTPPETTRQAQEILVNFRIPHHAIVGWWFDATAIVKILLVAAALYVSRRSRLFLILLLSLLVAAVLTLVQVLLDSDTLALLFPWRLSTFLVPLSTSILLAWLISSLVDARFVRTTGVSMGIVAGVMGALSPENTGNGVTINTVADNSARRLSGGSVTLFSTVLIILITLAGGVRFVIDLERKDASPERAMESFVRAYHQPGEVYLTPVKMQDFRLTTGAPVFVEFKSIPYRDADVLEWRRRIQLTDNFYKKPDCARLRDLAVEEKVTHAVLESAPEGASDGVADPLACDFMREVYRDEYYRIVALEK